MPPTINAYLRARRILKFALVLIALASCLALPGRCLNWLLPSVSATTTEGSAETTGDNNVGPATPGVISFAAQNYSANESDGAVGITLTRTGGSDGALSAKITLTDGTTSPSDYIFSPGSLDPTFITPPQIDGGSASTYSYPTMALQPDGKLLLASVRGVWRLNTDGSVDNTFTAGNAMNFGVTTVALQPDGKIIVGGAFTTINNQRANRLARLNSDGSLDPTFDVGTGPNESVSVIVIQPDGKLLISGYFMSFNGVSVGYEQVMRLNSDGSIDNSFTRDGIPGLAIALQPDGKILGVGSGGVKRGNTDGTIDNTFNAQFTGTYPFVFNLALQPDGKVVIVGFFDHVGGQVAYGVARLNANGSVDPTFNTGTGPDTTPQGLALQPDGKVLIGGSFKSFNGTAVNDLVRLNADGSLDTSFVPATTSLFGSTAINNILLQPDGKVFVRGHLSASGSNITNRYLARLRNDLFVTWAAGDANNKTVSLPVVDDLLDEPDETLNLTLVPLNGASVGANASATLTIIDSDVPPSITSALPPSVVNVNASYSHTFTATGAPAPTFSVTTGNLPPGLFLTSAGLLSGAPFIPGTYSLTVRASNGVAPAATQSFSIKVNGAPTAQFNSYSTIQNTTLTVAAPGVLGNDSDPNGDPITAALSVNPLHGTVTLNSDGSFVYVPTTGYFGSDNFSYIVNDGTLNSFAATVFLTINSGGTLSFSANPFSQVEDAGSATITVSRGGGSAGEVRVDYATSNGTATAGIDYTATSGTLIFANGVNTLTFSIPLTADQLIEPNETVNITLSNVQGTGSLGTQNTAVLNILNDDTPILQFQSAGYSLPEGSGSLPILVVRTGGGASLPVTVNYATSDVSSYLQNCNVFNGAATSRCDYVGVLGTLHFAANETSKTISIPIVDDTYVEGAETFFISLTNPTGGAALGTNRRAIIQITDNDTSVLSSNPIADVNFFVRQHYIDFLGREPDPASVGWLNQINNCVPSQPACDRLSVSQGIYSSPEFKDRGYFIYKFYSVAFGRKPTYDEFVLDRARVSGFQTEAELEQSKLDFIADFMSRPEFAPYAGLTNDQYVLTLFNLAGVTQVTVGGGVLNLSQMQQSMNNGKTRAQVLREMVESPEVSARFLVESTIVMHYFGYLRRDPDAAYQDWINIFNQTGDSRNVTNGFVNSLEYRNRFGQ
jgi:uncharacterized delta-60 repeat protein